ncbi:MAG TPA: GNAT family N-acetyltransferase [Ktedonobacterales bacterium]
MDAGRIVRPLVAEDLDAWLVILANAYPIMDLHTAEERAARLGSARMRLDTPGIRSYGLFHKDRLLGGMQLYDFEMTCFEAPLLVGGVGMVAVDLAHKREHVARDLISFYLRHYRERGAPLAILYPFRPDFYGAMGFGYGPKQNTYRISPDALPVRGDKSRARFLTDEDRGVMIALYNAVAMGAHGMIALTPATAATYLTQPKQRLVGWFDATGALRGYMAFTFEMPDRQRSFLLQDLEIHELIYSDSEALLGLLAFLRAQRDQVRAVILHTLLDGFHYLLADPRNGPDRPTPNVYHESNTQGVGLMYRLLDVRRFFEALPNHRFGVETLTMRLTLRDSFLPEHDGSIVVRFERGVAHVEASRTRVEVELTLAVSDASALLMGCLSLRALHDFGLAEVSDGRYVSRLDALFHVERPPVCLTAF